MFQKTEQSKRPKHFKQSITIPEGTVPKDAAPLKEEMLPKEEAALTEDTLLKKEEVLQEDVLPEGKVVLQEENPSTEKKAAAEEENKPLEKTLPMDEEKPSKREETSILEEELLQGDTPTVHEEARLEDESPLEGEALPKMGDEPLQAETLPKEESLQQEPHPAPREAPGLRDLHTHVVYGVDDGAQTPADMHAMLDQAVANGVTVIYATSHHTPGVEHFPQDTYTAHLQEARDYCAAKGYNLTLYPGAEILYTPALHNYIERRPLPTLGNSHCILMEFVPDVSLAEAEEAITLVEEHGYTPILAHIERYGNLNASKLRKIKQQHNVLYQVNCGTIVRGKGFFKTRALRSLLQSELIDFISSDMHNTHNRPNRMRECWDKLYAQYPQDYVRRLMTNEQSL